HTRFSRDWSSDVCSSDLAQGGLHQAEERAAGWRERVQAQAALVTERKVRLAQVKEQTEAARIALERVTSQLDDLTTRTARLQHRSEERRVGKEGSSGCAR